MQQFAVRRPITVAMCVAALFVFGLVSIGRMGLELLPNLSYPVVAVVTVYPNADPTTVERELTQPIEGAVSTLAGLRRLESTSMEHASLVIAQFDWGANLAEVMEQMNASFNVLAASLPSDAQRPLVVKMDPDQLPLMLIGMTGSGDLAELTLEADQIVRPALERLPGVAQVSILGGVRPEITVYYDMARLREEWLTPLHLQQLLIQQNALVPAGSFTASPGEVAQWNQALPGDDWWFDEPGAEPIFDAPLRYRIRVGHPLRSADDVADLVVGRRRTAGQDAMGFAALLPQLVRIRDVATVEAGHVPAEGFTRVNGESAVILRILKQSGENSVDVASQVRARVADLAVESGAGTDFFVITDQSDMITQSVANLSVTALIGGFLAVLVLYAFLRNLRSLFIIAFSIPFSIVVAIVIMQFSGLTLNIMTLGGLALGIGLVVDNSIVVLENIFRHRSEGKDRYDAAITGTSEVAWAITAATLTTMAVFLPLVFVQSIAGHLFRDLAITVACAVVGSLFVALVVVPALAAHLPGRSDDRAVTSTQASGRGAFSRLQQAYITSLRWTLDRPALAVGIVVVCGIGLILLPGRLQLELLPPMDGRMVAVSLKLPPGTPVEETDAVARQIETALRGFPEVTTVSVNVGPQGGDDFMSLIQEAPVHEAQITALLTPRSQRSRSAHQLATEWRELLPAPPHADLRISADRALDALGDEFNMAVTIEVTGPDLARIGAYAREVVEALEARGGFGEIVTSADQSQPELIFQVNPDRALLGGLTAGQIGLSMRAALTGLPATQLYIDGLTVPVVLRPKPDDIADMQGLSELRIPSFAAAGLEQNEPPPSARFGPLANPEIGTAPANIRHVDRMRVVTVTAQFDGIDLAEAGRRAEAALANIHPERGYELRLAGIHDTMNETVSDMGLALLLAVVFVYMAMAAQFESLRYPFVVMFTVPLAAVGAMGGLWMSGEYLSIPSMMGMITLCGIAVNNGIVLVDAINRLYGSGMPRIEAVVEAGRIRLRPILMTTLTTVIGLLPLAFRWGEGTELQAPLAVAVIWGLLLSTILTLFVVPSVYLMTGGRTKPTTHAHRGAVPS